LPFNGENYNQLLWAIAHDEPVPTTTQFGGDAKLWAILVRGFRKQRAGRWESMRDIGEALARWLYDQDVREDIAGSSLEITWLDRRQAENELFDADTRSPSEANPPETRRALRGEDAIPTLPGSFWSESQRSQQQRQVRRRVALGLLGAGCLVAVVGGLWLATPASDGVVAVSPGESSRPTESDRRSVGGPVVAPAPQEEQNSAMSVAPLEEEEEVPPDASAKAGSTRAPVPGPLPRPRRSNAQSWEKLKNPFD